MLTVTDSALRHLHDAINRADNCDGCFRMIARDDRTVGLILEDPAAGDETFRYEGSIVLAMPRTLSGPLSERTLDVDEEGQLILIPKVS